MDNPASRQTFCSPRSVTKFCLLYFTTLMVMVLIFIAVNCDYVNEEQLPWWWGFIFSLIFACSATGSALILLIYTDYSKVTEDAPHQDISGRTTLLNQADNSGGTFKTVLTINSSPDQSLKQPKSPPQPPNGPGTSSFINLTPSAIASPKVTVVDIPATSLRRKAGRASERAKPEKTRERVRQEEPPNMPPVQSNTNAERDTRRKARKKNKAKPTPTGAYGS